VYFALVVVTGMFSRCGIQSTLGLFKNRLSITFPQRIILNRTFCDEAPAKKGGKKGSASGASLKNSKSAEEEQLEAYHTVIDTAVEISRLSLFFFSSLYFSVSLYFLDRMRHTFPEDVAAEHARIGREYNRQMFIQHNQQVKDLTLKIYLQQDALAALPPHLLELASVIDETPPPRNRPYPIWQTPPVPGLSLVDPDGEENEEQSMALEKGHYIRDMFTTESENGFAQEEGDEREEGDDVDSGSDAEY
jgi:hypothetical protein